MKRLAAAASLALALAACGEMTPSNNQSGVRMANPDSDRLKAATPLNQRLTLLRAIHQTRHRCHRVVGGAWQQNYSGLEMWVALCDDGKHWSIFIAPNSEIQVRDCSEHEQLGLPVCRPVTPAPPDPNDPVDNPQVNASAAAFANGQ